MEKIKFNVSFPFTSVLFLLFLTLKLCGVIDWSWWLIIAPLWFTPAVFLMIIVIYALLTFLEIACKKIENLKRKKKTK